MKVRRWLPPLIWAGVILFATSLPKGMVPKAVDPLDKLLHAGIYAVFAVLLTREMGVFTGRWRAAVAAVAVAIAFGAVDEWHQRFIPGRSTELADWHADSAGAGIGALVWTLYSRHRAGRDGRR